MLPWEVAAVAAQGGDHCHWYVAAGQHHYRPLTSLACPTRIPPLRRQMEPETQAFHATDHSVCPVTTRVKQGTYSCAPL